MRVLWVNPSFLDYRVPVYQELFEMLGGELTIVYSKRRTPDRVIKKIESVMGDKAIGMTGEKRFFLGKRSTDMANRYLSLPYQPGLLSTIMKIPADAIIAEGFFQWAPAALLKSLWQKTPFLIAYERTHHTERNCPRWRESYRRWVIKHTDAVLCSGQQCVRYTESLGMPADRMTMGHMAADTDSLQQQVNAITPEEREAVRQKYNVKGVAFLYIGRLNDRKGVVPLIDAWAKFEKLNPGMATLLMTGMGDRKEYIERVIAGQGLSGVRLLGQIDYDQLAPVYGVADAFVFPTLEDNWALVVPESMACGLPIMCSQYTGCCTELIRPGENGWIFDPLNQDDILFFLDKCLKAQKQLKQMGQASREIIKNYTPHHAAQSIIDGCQIAIAHRKRSMLPSMTTRLV